MGDRNRDRRRGPRELVSGGEWICGRNPVEEALAAGRREASEIVLPPASPDEDGQLRRIREEALARRLVVRTMAREQLDRLVRHQHHQGVALKVAPFGYIDFAELLAAVRDDENAIVLALDHLEDPQNVGAILRTAAAIGVVGVVIPEDRACAVTPAAVRASAGGAEYVRVSRVVNLPRALAQLKEAGCWTTALDFGPDARPYTDVDFAGRAVLVVGAEGRGVSRLVRETCDFVAELPMPGGFESLNASVAAAVAMYEILRQRGGKSR